MRPHLLLSYDFPPIGGGIARWMGELALRYPERSLIVSTGSVEGSERSDPRFPVTIDRLPTPARRLRTIPGLARWSLRAEKLAKTHDVAFTWCGTIRPAGYPARWVDARRGVPYGVILHGGDLLILREQASRSGHKRRMARGLLGNAAALVTNSRFTWELARGTLAQFGIPHDEARIHVVPLGTDPTRFRPDVDPRPARDALDLPDGRWLVTVARLTPHKGIDTALQVLARLAPRHPDLRYAVAGEGNDRDRLTALAASLGVADRVRWLGAIGDDLLPSLLRNATAYLGLSRMEGIDVEGFGISLVEASGCGVPVVGTKSGGIPDAVRDGETGILVEPGDLDGTVVAVAGLLDDAGKQQRLGAGGRRAVEEFYNWDRVARDLRRIGDDATSRDRPSAR